MLLPFRDHTYVRLVSTRTGETLLELKMIGGGVIVWGAHYRPDEADVCLSEDGCSVTVTGALCDRIGPVVTFNEHIEIHAGFSVEAGELPPGFDASTRTAHSTGGNLPTRESNIRLNVASIAVRLTRE